MRVLLVDDEALALDRLRTFFADIEGVEVVGQAQDGDQALERITELTPDLVIMDVQMPGRNGLRAAAEIAVDPKPEIVFVTAHEHYAPDAFDVDAADYLLKPVRFDRLRQAVDRARRRRAVRAQAERAGQLEQEVEQLRSAKPPARDDAGFWIPERDGHRRVAIEIIDWVAGGARLCASPLRHAQPSAAHHHVPRWRQTRRITADARPPLRLRSPDKDGGGEARHLAPCRWCCRTAAVGAGRPELMRRLSRQR
jgi:DNA-binding NarL/FixJ family response regulator